MILKEIAHSRTGDKGDKVNISIIPYDEKDFKLIGDKLTEERVKQFFNEICKGDVKRYELSGIKAYNYVLDKMLNGGVSINQSLDRHGKSLGSALLEINI
ncbi:hypothetical protein LEQ06_12050 [Paraclostridium sp. AKS46]|uniref:AtuA-like ferredoxin-fold domain-containing protein n=1 Tax=Paraclostridium bifermentans TaxID=1490 RepID=A0A5P3XFL1_PARBF|nr:hypothetical protein [Paraclostridium bifermentans]MCU9808827.1 hypothetical protein [Paraclostridium sp. AKS46]QEZ69115.1 hypothetical protein D4A35_09295 [Paraclostridium bifermentans]